MNERREKSIFQFLPPGVCLLEKFDLKFLTAAMKVAEQLWHFAQFNGHQEPALSLGKSNHLIYALKLRVSRIILSIDISFLQYV